MRLMAYTRKHPKTGIYWYRRAVPPRLRGHLPPVSGFGNKTDRTEYTKSLETRDLRQANRKAGEIDRRIQAALDQAQAVLDGSAATSVAVRVSAAPRPPASGYTRQQLRSAVAEWHRAEMERAEAEIIANPPTDPEQAAAAEMDRAGKWWSVTEPDAHLANSDLYPALAKALASRGMTIAADHPALSHVAEPFAFASSHLCMVRHHMLRGEWRAVDDIREEADEWMSASSGPHLPPATPAPEPDKPADPRADKPFLDAISSWKKDMPYRGRQISTYIADVRSYAAVIADGPISAVDYDSIQRWVSEIQSSGLTAKTAKRKLSALSSYWRYLRHKGHVPRAEFPGRGITIMRDTKSPSDQRQSFSPEQVVNLWRMAEAEGDHVLANAIKLAAYTGARIESLFQAKVSDIDETAGIPFVRFGDKTTAGLRCVPIHTAIRPLVERLRSSPEAGGYLLPGRPNPHGERSAAVGKRFGRMRTRAGFGHQHVFHSIRRTVASMLFTMGVKEAKAAQILGHEYTRMTYGVYADALAVPVLSPLMEAAIEYPEAP